MSETLHGVLYTAVALILLTGVGNLACRVLFRLSGLIPESATGDGDPPAGRIIGWLERLLLAFGIVLQSWQVVAAVIALKSVARFRELDDKTFAEYFLVGSLFSLLWAVVVTLGWQVYDRSYGLGLSEAIAAWAAP